MKNNGHDWKNLLFELTKREISVRYKKTYLGFLWMFLNPLSQMVILGFVFQNFTTLSIRTSNYFLFLFVGLVIWNFFSNTLNTTVQIYVHERALLQKSKFPREIILISVMLSNVFHYLISLAVLFIIMLIYLVIKNEINGLVLLFLRLPLILISTTWLSCITTGIALGLSALNVKFRDISFFTTAALPLLFYGSPIIWEMHFVPEKFLSFLYLNPLTPILEINRYVFLNESIANPSGIVTGIFTSVLIMAIGFHIFRKESPFFDDWL